MKPRYALEILEWATEDSRQDDETVREAVAVLKTALVTRSGLLRACKEAAHWLQAAPVDELEAVEHALGMTAPLGQLQAAIIESSEEAT